MKQKNAYLYTLAAIIILFMAGYFFHLEPLDQITSGIIRALHSPVLVTSSVICAFIFLNNKHYWLLLCACAIILSLFIQYGLIGQSGGVIVIIIRALAFLLAAYLLNLIKVIFTK